MKAMGGCLYREIGMTCKRSLKLLPKTTLRSPTLQRTKQSVNMHAINMLTVSASSSNASGELSSYAVASQLLAASEHRVGYLLLTGCVRMCRVPFTIEEP